jgi:hypothetical protein
MVKLTMIGWRSAVVLGVFPERVAHAMMVTDYRGWSYMLEPV